MRTTILILAGILLTILPCAAQYGGRPGDTVLYVFTSNGTGAISTLPSTTNNTASGLLYVDPNTVTPEPFPAPFTGESRLVFHMEDGDVFEFIFAHQDFLDPNQENTAPAKVLIGGGLLRIQPTGEGNIDAPATFFTDFPNQINIAPHLSLTSDYRLVFWTNSLVFPVAIPVPITFVSPVPPPGVSGADYVISLGVFPGLIPWQGLDRMFPSTGWQQGTDIKVLGQDPTLNTTVRLMRLRPGRTTAPFAINGHAHFLVLQGSVQLGPAGGASKTLTQWDYAFAPSGYSVQLSNPAAYAGPGASQ